MIAQIRNTGKCPNCLKSKPSAAGLMPRWPGRGSPRSSCGDRICGFRFRSVLLSASLANASRRSGGGQNILLPISTARTFSSCTSECQGRSASNNPGRQYRVTVRKTPRTIMSRSNSRPARASFTTIHAASNFMQLIPRPEFAAHPLFRNIGIEPLGGEFDGVALARLFAGKTTPLKAALLDQKLIAGLGNIYVCEALHRAGLSPRRAAGSLVRNDGTPRPRAIRLASVIRDVLNEAVAAGGSSLRDHRQTDGALGYFQHNFRVYSRTGHPCACCGGPVRRITQGGRATFYCGGCQR